MLRAWDCLLVRAALHKAAACRADTSTGLASAWGYYRLDHCRIGPSGQCGVWNNPGMAGLARSAAACVAWRQGYAPIGEIESWTHDLRDGGNTGAADGDRTAVAHLLSSAAYRSRVRCPASSHIHSELRSADRKSTR